MLLYFFYTYFFNTYILHFCGEIRLDGLLIDCLYGRTQCYIHVMRSSIKEIEVDV